MNLLFEDMIRVETDKYICRIWRQHGISGIGNIPLAHLADQMLREKIDPPEAYRDIVRTLIEHDRVNSVEIVQRWDGCGVCVHKDWP